LRFSAPQTNLTVVDIGFGGSFEVGCIGGHGGCESMGVRVRNNNRRWSTVVTIGCNSSELGRLCSRV
jgi:hypothetical protein